MKPEIKKLWVDALRSGKYAQAKEALRTKDGYCCLGVLCDIHKLATDSIDWKPLQDNYKYLTETGYLPWDVVVWSGVGESDPLVPIEGLQHCERRLSSLNDNDYTFDQIADIIEKEM